MSKKNDDVGYKKPPKKTQFKKGQSGNPKGRPSKAPPNTLEGIISIMQKEVPVSMNGKTQKLTQASIFFLQTYKKACEGHGPSQKIICDLLQKYILPAEAKALEYELKKRHREERPEPKTAEEAAQIYRELIQSL